MPDRLDPQSRVPTQAHHVNGVLVRLRPIDSKELPGMPIEVRWSWGAVTLDVLAESSHEEIERGMNSLEAAMESLSFQFQAALKLDSLEALDVSPPVAEGDEREMELYPIGIGYPLRRYRAASVPLTGVVTERVPDLGLAMADLNDQQRAALDWYLKSLGALHQMDQFIFLWIAAEILWTLSEVSVEAPYRGSCGHEVRACPTCSRPTTRQVRGQSIQRFFVEAFGIDEKTARELWRARQVMHGAARFDSNLIERLDQLSHTLRALVNAGLKVALGLSGQGPPLVAADQASVASHMSLGGMRRVDAQDL